MNRTKSRKLKWAIVILCFITIGGVLFLGNWPSFGGTVSGERLKRVQASPRPLLALRGISDEPWGF